MILAASAKLSQRWEYDSNDAVLDFRLEVACNAGQKQPLIHLFRASTAAHRHTDPPPDEINGNTGRCYDQTRPRRSGLVYGEHAENHRRPQNVQDWHQRIPKSLVGPGCVRALIPQSKDTGYR